MTFVCGECGSINNCYWCCKCRACTDENCILCKTRCGRSGCFTQTFKKCNVCNHIYNIKSCSCLNGSTCKGKNKICNHCYDFINIGDVNVCIDEFLRLLENKIVFCQVCHKFIYNIHENHKSHHTIIKKKKSLVQIAKLKYPQIKRFLN
jgi:hypothetical protein